MRNATKERRYLTHVGPDFALETADTILFNAVCECGHLNSDHLYDPDDCSGFDDGEECPCREFRPVTFTVIREPR